MFSHIYKSVSLLIMLAILLSSCATTPQRLTYTNFNKINKNMTEQEVINILGEPTKVSSGSIDTGIDSILGIGGLSGTSMIWITNDAKANIIFVKGKVISLNFTNQF